MIMRLAAVFCTGMLLAGITRAQTTPASQAEQQEKDRAAELQRRAGQLFTAGLEAYDAGRYGTALFSFQEAYRIRPHPAVHVNMANCYDKLDKPLQAVFHFERFLRDMGRKASSRQRREVRAAVRRLRKRIGSLELQVVPDGAHIRIDDDEVLRAPVLHPVELAQGTHRVVIEHPGYVTERREVVIQGGKRAEVNLALAMIGAQAPTVPPRPAPAPTLAPAPPKPAVATPVKPAHAGPPAPIAPAAAPVAPAPAAAPVAPVAPAPAPVVVPSPALPPPQPPAAAPAPPAPLAAEPPLRPTEPLPPLDAEPAPDYRTEIWWMTGITGTLLTASIATGVLAVYFNRKFESSYPDAGNPALPTAQQDKAWADAVNSADNARMLAITTDVLLGTSVVTAGIAAYWCWKAQPETEEAMVRLAPEVGPRKLAMQLHGRF
ncbi:MAG: PEGA domain-containing protein [Proteobacteria bacterium]|nr:PEGA domain-containing protein [Pseudomonadota bacterium]